MVLIQRGGPDPVPLPLGEGQGQGYYTEDLAAPAGPPVGPLLELTLVVGAPLGPCCQRQFSDDSHCYGETPWRKVIPG
jgi:hypothetical protein